MSEFPEFLTVEEAAALLRIGRTSAYALAREWRESGGREGLPVVKLGRQLRVPRAALEELHQAAPDLRRAEDRLDQNSGQENGVATTNDTKSFELS